MKQACEELRRLHDDDQREAAEMRILHQQVPVEPSDPSSFMLTQRQMMMQNLVPTVQTALYVFHAPTALEMQSIWILTIETNQCISLSLEDHCVQDDNIIQRNRFRQTRTLSPSIKTFFQIRQMTCRLSFTLSPSVFNDLTRLQSDNMSIRECLTWLLGSKDTCLLNLRAHVIIG